jgi:hypothetical protein
VHVRPRRILLDVLAKRLAMAVVVAFAVASCAGEASKTESQPASSPRSPKAAEHSASAVPGPSSEACPVTAPRPVDSRYPWRASLFGWHSAHGNGKLWVGGLGPGGVIDRRSWKFGWWRAVPGHLRITGRRIDAAAPPVRSSVPSGYGRTGFQSSGVDFPTEGCWQVTGQAGGASLSFVTLVTRA